MEQTQTKTVTPTENEAKKWPANTDPYIYGWRYEARVDMNGIRRHVKIPLTLEDIRHPQEDDYRMHSYEHEKFCRYLANVFEHQLAHRPDAAVLADVRTAWDKPEAKPNTPDISVVFGLKRIINWSTFYEREEGTRPTLVVEITSPTTRHVDLVEKFADYEYAEVAYYVIVDKYEHHKNWQQRLLAYQLTSEGYDPLPVNEQGWIWLEPVRVWLAWADEKLACFNQQGELLLDYAEIAQQVEAEIQARQQAEEQAAAEAQARQQAEERAQQAEERAQQAEERAQQAEERAVAAAQAHSEMEARFREMEAQLRRMEGGSSDEEAD